MYCNIRKKITLLKVTDTYIGVPKNIALLKFTLLKVTDTYIAVQKNIALLKFALLEVNND